MQGIRRNIGTAQRRVSALTPEQLHTIVAALPEGLIGLRDRALLVVGFGGGFRRSELVALDRSDLMFTADGLELTIRRSKTDQEGAGRKLGIPFGAHRQTCGVRTMQEWLAASGITEGAVWRPITRHGALGSERLADRAVALVLKRCLARVGIDPTSFAGHSLRSGLVTAAFKAGKSEATIMAQTGHKSAEVMRRYRRETDLFAANAAGGIGL
jgi:integrase